MRKLLLALMIVAIVAFNANAAFVTVADKSTSDSLTAAEFNQILDAIKDGTLDLNTGDLTATAINIGATEITSAELGILNTYAGIDPAANVQSILGAADYAAIRGLLDLEAGTDFYSVSAADLAFQPLESTLTDIADGTIAENLVNTANPWADNEVVDALTISGGTVNNSVIGGSTAAAITGTTVKANTSFILEGGANDTTLIAGSPTESVSYTLPAADGIDGQYISTNGSGVLSFTDPPGGGDISQVGDAESGASFTADGTGNVLYFEGTTENGFEIALTGANPGSDVVVTIPATTGTLLLEAGTGASLTAVDAVTGDSATAFFDAGTIEHERGGLEADVSAYAGLVKITGGSTSAVTTTAFAESILDDADEATFKATVNLEIGTDVLAQQTIGIANDNLLEVDGSPNSGEAAVFTANGINGLSEAEFKTAFNIEAGVDFEAVDADILRADTVDTITANWTHSGTLALNGEVTMGADFNINTNEIQSTGDITLQLGDATGTYKLILEDSSGTDVWWVDSDGVTGTPAANNPYYKWDENDGVDYFMGIYDTTVDRLEIRRSTTVNTNVDWYVDSDGMWVGGNSNLSTGHTYQVNGSQINYANLAQAGNATPTGTWNFTSATLQNIGAGTVTNGSNYTTVSNSASDDTINELFAAIDTWASGVSAGTLITLSDVESADYTAGTILVGDGSNSYDMKSISGVISLDASGATSFANGDRGEITASGGSFAIDAGVIDAANLSFSAAPGVGNDDYAVTYNHAGGNFTLVEMTGGAETNSLETTVTGIADTEIFVGNGDNSGAFVTISGDATLANTGALTIANNAIESAMMADNAIDTAELADDAVGAAEVDWGSGANQIDLADIPGGAAGASAFDFGGATSVEITNGTDPDVDAAGEISWDSDDFTIRGFDGTNQVAVGRKIDTLPFTIVKPNDFADATRDKLFLWENASGMSFIITRIKVWSDTDDTALNIEEYDADGASNNATIDAINATDGSGPYTATETTITGATIEAGHTIYVDFDDTDDPGQVAISISGYYNANVD